MDYIQLIGFLAGGIVTISWIPQVWKVVYTKQTRDLSLLMFLIISLGSILWVAYGFLINSMPIIVPNIIILAMCLVILGYKIRYK